MTFDFNKFAPERRAELIKKGKAYSSRETLAQANQTLISLKLHGSKLVNHGFNALDAAELESARDALAASGVGREQRLVDKRTVSMTQGAEMNRAQTLRIRSIAMLNAARRMLRDDTSEASMAAVLVIDATLERHKAAPPTPELMAVQLEALRDVLAHPAIAKAAKSRGGTELASALTPQVIALRAVNQASDSRGGTPEETETLNLLDGVIVELVRGARHAARAAARALGEPTVAEAFKLTALYRRGLRKKKSESLETMKAA